MSLSIDFRTTAASIAILSAFTMTANAQDAQQETIELAPITVEAGGTDDKHAGAADRANSITIDGEAVEDNALGDLKSLFAGDASVTVGGAIPLAQKIYVNGIDILNLAVTIDGVPQNNRAFHHTSANAIDPGLLKAVRVDPTVAPADAGPGALAGSVVFETVDVGDLLEDGDNFGAYGVLGYDSNGRTLSEIVSAYGRHGGFEGLGYVKNAKGDNYEDGNGDTIRGTAADLQSFLLKGAYEADGHRVELSGERMIDDALRRYRANFGGVIGGRPVPELRVYDTDRQSYSFRYEATEPEGFWDPTVVIGYSRNDVRIPDPDDSRGLSDTFSVKVENTFNFSDTHALTAGVDLTDRTGTYTGLSSPNGLEETSLNLGIYLQDRIDVTERFDVSFGGRFDWQRFEGINGFEDDFSGFSGNISGRYEVVDDLFLKAGYSNVFGGVVIEDNYIFVPSWTYADLDPVRAGNVVVGFEYRPDRWSLEASVFRSDFDDARSGQGTADFVSQGFNIGAGFNWDGGSIKATYSNTRIEVNGGATGSYEALDFGAPLGQVIALTAQHTYAPWNLTFGASLDMALDYDGPIGAEDATKELEGYEVVSLFLEYEPQMIEGLTLRLEANNIFDTAYADRGTYGGEYDSLNQLLEPGRSFFVSAKKVF